jgi:tagatose 6-phosphate kinase
LGNPVGAGDAFVAGIAVSLAHGASLEDTLRLGCAWAVVSLHSPWAGHVDPDAVAAVKLQIVVDPIANIAVAETEDGP